MNTYTRILLLFILVLSNESILGFDVFSYPSHSTGASPFEAPPHTHSILRELYLPPQPDDKPAYHQREQVQLI